MTQEHPDVQRARYEFSEAERILRKVQAASKRDSADDAGLYLAHKEYKRAARVLRDVSSYYESGSAHPTTNTPAGFQWSSPAKLIVGAFSPSSAFSPPSASTPKKGGHGKIMTAALNQVGRPFSPPFTQKRVTPVSSQFGQPVVQPLSPPFTQRPAKSLTKVGSPVVRPFSPLSTPKREGPVSAASTMKRYNAALKCLLRK